MVFQAEVFAELASAQNNTAGDFLGKHIYISSDIQAALKTLSFYEITSRVILECLQALNQLGSRNSGYCGYSVTEKLRRMKPEPAAEVPFSIKSDKRSE